MNTDISETIKDDISETIKEINGISDLKFSTQHEFVTQICHDHSNAHKPVAPTIFLEDKKF